MSQNDTPDERALLPWEAAKAAYIAGPDNRRDHSDLWQFVVDAVLRAARTQPLPPADEPLCAELTDEQIDKMLTAQTPSSFGAVYGWSEPSRRSMRNALAALALEPVRWLCRWFPPGGQSWREEVLHEKPPKNAGYDEVFPLFATRALERTPETAEPPALSDELNELACNFNPWTKERQVLERAIAALTPPPEQAELPALTDALRAWAHLNEPEDDDWHRGYEAARGWVQMQLGIASKALTDEQIIGLPVWAPFVGLMPEHKIEIARGILASTPPPEQASTPPDPIELTPYMLAYAMGRMDAGTREEYQFRLFWRFAMEAFANEQASTPRAEPAAYMYSHDESTRMTFRMPDERMNERRWHETPLYTLPPSTAPDEAAAVAALRELPDRIEGLPSWRRSDWSLLKSDILEVLEEAARRVLGGNPDPGR